MRRRLALLVCTALVAATGATSHAAAPAPQAVAAKHCSAGYTHAIINHQEKCLRRGEFCAHKYRRQYQRYGYDCVKRDRRGNYHLS